MAILKEIPKANDDSSNLAIPSKDMHSEDSLQTMESNAHDHEIAVENAGEKQQLTASDINPQKLAMLLRTRFGIGRYEIEVSLCSSK